MKVLFVCYGNSCRSPMAEAIFNTKSGDGPHQALSAGLNPADIIQPETIKVLQEKGFETNGLNPEQVTDELLDGADKIIALDNYINSGLNYRADEIWHISDPYRQNIQNYRNTRDILIKKVENLINKINNSNQI